MDRSVYNLSSIVVLAEAEGRRMLLTGDARGDDILQALLEAKLRSEERPFQVDVLKLPHHGSDRNVDQEFFDSIRALHYVISANGKDTNPDVPTLEMISRSRTDDDFTVWLTNAPSDFEVEGVGKEVAGFFAEETAKGRRYRVVYRDPDELSVRIELPGVPA